MSYGPGNNTLVTDSLPPTGDTVEEAINKLDAQLDALYEQLNADAQTYATKTELEGTYATKTELEDYQPAISILTAEPSAGSLAEGEIAFVVEA